MHVGGKESNRILSLELEFPINLDANVKHPFFPPQLSHPEVFRDWRKTLQLGGKVSRRLWRCQDNKVQTERKRGEKEEMNGLLSMAALE